MRQRIFAQHSSRTSSLHFLQLAILTLGASTGCASQELLVERGTSTLVEKLPTSGFPHVLQTSVLDDGVHVALSRADCQTVSSTPITTTNRTYDRSGRIFNGSVLLLGGVGLGVGSYYLYDQAQSEPNREICKTDSSGKESCANRHQSGEIIAAAVAAGSVLVTGWGIWEMFGGHQKVTAERTSQNSEDVPVKMNPCAAPVSGVAIAVQMRHGGLVKGTTDTKGEAVLPIDDETLMDNAEQPIAKLEVAGRPRGNVDLSQLITAARPRWEAAQRLAGKIKPTEDREGMARADAAAVWSGLFRGEEHAGIPVTTCTPNGSESCFDAIDNDCDGRYDNDCGYSTGVLQWTLAWSGPADLDLHVVGPDGREVYWQNPRNPATKLLLDRDCRGLVDGQADCPNGNIENVFVPANEEPVPGTYRAWVQVANMNGDPGSTPITATLGGRTGSKTWRGQFQLAPTQGALYHLAYAVGPDQDGDGVGDGQDACPNEPGRWSDDRQASGCADQDNDGVPDRADACPAEVGLTQAKDMAHNGCPLVMGTARVTNLGVEIKSNIEFDTGKATLRPSATHILNDVVSAIHALPSGVTRLGVDGHTDAQGNDGENVSLSQRRAQAVVDYLGTHGVARSVLMARGFGETRPIADNDSMLGKQKNRRVELRVLEPRPKTADPWDSVKSG